MTLAAIVGLIPPPPAPSEVGTLTDWQAVEEELGITFPRDYREFVFAYGSGYLGQFYQVWNPFRGAAFVRHVRLICGYDRDFRRQFPQYSPHPIYPESPGYLPWGSDDNGNYYGWLTEGPPDQWPVLSNEVRGKHFQIHRVTMTGYLAGVFHGEIKPLAGGYPNPEDLTFRAADLPAR